MRKAAANSEKISLLAIDLAEPCIPKNEIVAEVAAAYRGADGDWGDYPPSFRSCPRAPTLPQRT